MTTKESYQNMAAKICDGINITIIVSKAIPARQNIKMTTEKQEVKTGNILKF